MVRNGLKRLVVPLDQYLRQNTPLKIQYILPTRHNIILAGANMPIDELAPFLLFHLP
jgi:hypothetical protein